MVGFADRKRWERIALVSDHEALINGIKAFAWMVPGEVRTYPMNRLDDAKANRAFTLLAPHVGLTIWQP